MARHDVRDDRGMTTVRNDRRAPALAGRTLAAGVFAKNGVWVGHRLKPAAYVLEVMTWVVV